MKKYVFISYKAEDFEKADRIRQNLNSYGIDCWMAPNSIKGGASYASEIPSAIRNCTVFLLIMTGNTQKSKWVPREVDQAINENKTLLPYYLEKCELKDEFKFYLTNVQSYFQYEKHGDAFEMLLKRIGTEIGSDIVYEGENRNEARELKRRQEEQAALEADAQAEKKRPKKTEKPKKEKTTYRKKSAIVISALLIVALIALTVVINVTSTVKIGSKKYKKSETSLYISGVTFTQNDMQSLEKMKNLKSISLTDCTFEASDIRNLLSKATNDLALVNCGVTDEMLEGNVRADTLRTIDLSNNKGVSSIAFLNSGAPNLYKLIINNTSVKDVSAVGGCTKLQYFYADNLELTDIPDMKGLTVISINNNRLSSLDFLKDCSELSEVYANGNELPNLDALEKCIKLSVIEAGKNKITDISGLKNTTLLKRVFLSHNLINDFSPLNNTANAITALYISDNKLETAQTLPPMPELLYFNIDNNSVTSLGVLNDSKKLEEFSANHNELTSADFLSDKSMVCYADLSYNHITDFVFDSENGFATDESVKKVLLDVSNNEINSFLLKKTDFSYLNVSSNPIESFRNFKSITASENYEWLKTVNVDNELVLDYKEDIPFSEMNIYGKVCILGCPLDKQLAVSSALSKEPIYLDSYNYNGLYVTDNVKGNPEWY